MSFADVILIGLILLTVFFALRSMYKKRKKGGGCCGNCSGCNLGDDLCNKG